MTDLSKNVKAGKRITAAALTFLAVSVLSLLLTYLLNYPPNPDEGNIANDYIPVLEAPDKIDRDGRGRFYLHTKGGTLCYDADWNYVCTFASNKSSEFWAENDLLCFRYYGDGRVRVYDLDGNYLTSLSEKAPAQTGWPDQTTDENGVEYTLFGGTLFPGVRSSAGEIVWRGPLIGTALKCAAALALTVNLLWLLVYSILTAYKDFSDHARLGMN